MDRFLSVMGGLLLSWRVVLLQLLLQIHFSNSFSAKNNVRPPLTVEEFRSKLPPHLLEDYDRLFPSSSSPQSGSNIKLEILKKDDEKKDEKIKGWENDKNWYPGKDDPMDGSVPVSFDYLNEFMMDTFVSYGISVEDAKVASDVLMEADKRGIYSHGIGRLKPIYCDRWDQGILNVGTEVTIEQEKEGVALVNGNLGLGLAMGPKCMQMAIDKAKKYGVGCVIAKNSTHYGIAGYYATMATSQGCVGFTTTNARPSIAPTFGTVGMMGTNPITFGIPTDEKFPFVIDCATSVNQRGKIEKYARTGESTPPGQVIDLQGNVRTDTLGILDDLVKGTAALCPMGGAGDDMGGYKGYGWAVAVELLCTAFQHGPFGEELAGIDRATGEKKSMPLGHIFLAIDVSAFTNLKEFEKSAGSLLRAVRASPKDPNGPGRIWTAGEPEYDHYMEKLHKENKSIMIPPALQNDMKNLRDGPKFSKELKAKYEKFEWE